MKNKIILLSVVFILLEIALCLSVRHFEDRYLSEHMQAQTSSLSRSYTNSINSARNISRILFKLMIDNKETLSIFAKASEANTVQRNIIRKELYEKLKTMYHEQQSVGLKQLHFHLPDSTSFLRMHKPSEYGDSLKGLRNTVDIANKYNKYSEGFEEGRVYNGFRFVYPLTYEGKHIGSVELSISTKYIASNMDSLEGGLHDFIIKKSVVSSMVFSSDQYNYVPSIISPDYLREVTSFDDLSRNHSVFSSTDEYLNTLRLMQKKAQAHLNAGKPFAEHICVNGKEITSAFLPVYDPKKEHVAYFINTIIDDRYQHIVYVCNMTIIAGSVAMFLIFCIIYLFMINMLKTKRLNIALDEKLHEHEEQLRFKEEILFQQSKLATLGEMFSALAHQWKQPLNILAMYIQNLLDDDENLSKEETAKREQIVDKCMAQITYMSETINDFMDFIRPADAMETKMDAARTVEDIMKLLKPSMDKKKIEMTLECDSKDRLYARANSNEMKHILVNIINNAKDAILDVKKNDRMFIGKIKIDIARLDGQCVIKIADNGGGINNEVIEHIFMPYVSTKQKKDGSGLGLYMCKTIISKYNGTLSVKNIENGAEFTIIIPMAAQNTVI